MNCGPVAHTAPALCHLPPDSLDARICTFECTFCARCADEVFENVCPNCGGGLEKRPVRPAQAYHPPWFLGAHPAREDRVHRPKDLGQLRELQARLRRVDPHAR